MTETFIKERKHNLTGKVEKVGIDDACAFLCRFDNGSLATVRIDPLRPRPQGAVHVRDQRRERLDQLGPARPAPPAILRPPRRGPAARLASRSTSPTATIPTWASGGCRACRSATSTASSHQVADFLEGLASGKPAEPDVPRRPGDAAACCDAVLRLGEGPEVGEGGEGLRVVGNGASMQSGCSTNPASDPAV